MNKCLSNMIACLMIISGNAWSMEYDLEFEQKPPYPVINLTASQWQIDEYHGERKDQEALDLQIFRYQSFQLRAAWFACAYYCRKFDWIADELIQESIVNFDRDGNDLLICQSKKVREYQSNPPHNLEHIVEREMIHWWGTSLSYQDKLNYLLKQKKLKYEFIESL